MVNAFELGQLMFQIPVCTFSPLQAYFQNYCTFKHVYFPSHCCQYLSVTNFHKFWNCPHIYPIFLQSFFQILYNYLLCFINSSNTIEIPVGNTILSANLIPFIFRLLISISPLFSKILKHTAKVEKIKRADDWQRAVSSVFSSCLLSAQFCIRCCRRKKTGWNSS